MKKDVFKDLLRYATIGGTLGLMTACSIGGHGGDNNPFESSRKTSGVKRYIQGTVVGYFLPDGTSKTVNAALHYSGSKVYKVESRRSFAGPGHNVNDPCYALHCFASTNGQTLLAASDTNGDGWISSTSIGPEAAACSITSGVGVTGGAMPISAYFGDTLTCPNGGDPDFSTTRTEFTGVGRIIMDQDPSGPNALISRVPASVMQDILNSIDQTDIRTEVRGGEKVQVIRAAITNVRIGGAAYRPVGVGIEIENMSPSLTVRKDNPGAKLLAAWVANQMEKLLDRGVTKFNGSVTINDSVTLNPDQFGDMGILHSTFGRAQVDRLREFASRSGRGE